MAPSGKLAVRIALVAMLVAAVAGVVLLAQSRRGVDSALAGPWTCSMHPQIRQPGPGRCPICGMDLIPIAQLAKEQARIDERAGVYVEPIAYRELFKEIRTVGKIDFNERQIAFIAARVNGRVDEVHADFTGIQVKKNDHLVDIYSPDLFIGQSELIRTLESAEALKKSGGDPSFVNAALEASRSKLRLLGLLPEQLAEIEKTRKIRTHLTIHAPIGGTVIEKNVRVGQYLKEGDVLYRIADLNPIWLYLDVYEYDLGWVRFGQKVDVRVEAYPGERFVGQVVFVDPFLDDKTRTVRARVNLPNPDKKLKPAMYASAIIRVKLRADGTPEPTGLEGKYVCPMHPEIVRDKEGRCDICGMPLEKVPDLRQLLFKPKQDEHAHHKHEASAKKEDPAAKVKVSEPGKVLAVPTSAVLDTGRRKIAYRQTKDGAYELVELDLGPRAESLDAKGKRGDYFAVLGGLNAGDRVVIQGAFLLDSQRQIEGMPSLLFPEGHGPANVHAGHEMPAPKVEAPSVHKH